MPMRWVADPSSESSENVGRKVGFWYAGQKAQLSWRRVLGLFRSRIALLWARGRNNTEIRQMR
jgi:hypothetical protein